MKRLGVFVTEKELSAIQTAQKCSGMLLSGGQPMGNPQSEVEQLRKKYGLPENVAFDPSNGEFVEPEL